MGYWPHIGVKGVEATSVFAYLSEGYNGHFRFGMGCRKRVWGGERICP